MSLSDSVKFWSDQTESRLSNEMFCFYRLLFMKMKIRTTRELSSTWLHVTCQMKMKKFINYLDFSTSIINWEEEKFINEHSFSSLTEKMMDLIDNEPLCLTNRIVSSSFSSSNWTRREREKMTPPLRFVFHLNPNSSCNDWLRFLSSQFVMTKEWFTLKR